MIFAASADAQILLWIQENLRNPYLTPFMKFFSFLGEAGWFWIALTLILILSRKTRGRGILCAASLGSSFLITLILKNIVCRTRPYDAVPGLSRLVAKLSDYSFPSGHTSASFAVALVILMTFPKKYGVPAVILASLIAFSRMYVGVHYPTDIIAGFCIALITSLVFCKASPLRKWSGRERASAE